MKEIWLICSGCYSDINWRGFFETEQEAKDYCEWHNKYTSDNWNQVWYSKVNSMSFKNEKENNKTVYKITTDGYVIKENEIEVMLRFNPSNRYEVVLDEEYDFELDDYVYDEDSFRFNLEIVCDDKNKAIKIARDVIAQIKEKYIECEDWTLAMESVGGYVW
jgi:hypothetical protein